MFNRHYKTHGFDGFVDDSDSDEEEETFVQNLWGSYGTRSRFGNKFEIIYRSFQNQLLIGTVFLALCIPKSN